MIGSSFTLSNTTGNITLGAMTSPGTITVTNNDNGGGFGNVSVIGAMSSTGGAIALTTGTSGTLSISGTGSVVTSGSGTDISLSAPTLSNAGNVSANRDLIISSNNLSNTGTMITGRDLDVSSFTARGSIITYWS